MRRKIEKQGNILPCYDTYIKRYGQYIETINFMFSERKIYEGIYSVLEQEFNEISKFIAFTEDNLNTYSIKIQELHLRICSEVENVLKIITHKHFKTKKETELLWKENKALFLENKNQIDEYERLKEALNGREKKKVENLLFGYPDFNFYFKLANENFKLNIKSIYFNSMLNTNSELSILNPFEIKNDEVVPYWWTSYNKIKHNKINEFNRCTLKDLINSMGGLYILMNYLTKYVKGNKPWWSNKRPDHIFGFSDSFENYSFNSKNFTATKISQSLYIKARLQDRISEKEYQDLLKKYNGLDNIDNTEIDRKLDSKECSIYHHYNDYGSAVSTDGKETRYRQKLDYCKFVN